MKGFYKKTLIIFITAVMFMFIVGDLIHVGDKNYTYNDSINYNGYFSKVDEDKFIQLGLTYVEDDDTFGSFYIIDYGVQTTFTLGLTREYLMYDSNYSTNNLYFYGVFITYSFSNQLQSASINGVDGVVSEAQLVNDYMLIIIGISNYEV